MNAPAFEACGLRVSLGGTEILHGIDLVVPAGRWTAVVGPNGAGKSTLLKSLAHLLPHHGQVALLGRTAWSPRERARTVAWLGQGEGSAVDLPARDVVMLGRLPHQDWLGATRDDDEAAVQWAMQETQCAQWARRPLASLSGGERQRVLLARALAVQAPVLVMDEPLASLDPPHQSDWLAIVRRHVARGGTAVSVLHEITMALHADDVVVVAGGRVAHHGPCLDAATHRAVEQVFDNRIRVQAVGAQYVALPAEEAGA